MQPGDLVLVKVEPWTENTSLALIEKMEQLDEGPPGAILITLKGLAGLRDNQPAKGRTYNALDSEIFPPDSLINATGNTCDTFPKRQAKQGEKYCVFLFGFLDNSFPYNEYDAMKEYANSLHGHVSVLIRPCPKSR
jgi:hypothetical protein